MTIIKAGNPLFDILPKIRLNQSINQSIKSILCTGWGSPVSCLEQAPAIDVVAVGLRSGDIYLHNLKGGIQLRSSLYISFFLEENGESVNF